MTRIFGTLGFTPQKLIPTIRQRDDVQEVVVFHDTHERSRAAAERVRTYCEDLAVGFEARELDAFDILTCAQAIRTRLRDAPTDEVVFNITGGTPIISSAALLTCLLEGVRAVTVDERTGKEVQLPLLSIRYEEILNESQRGILRHILEHPGCTQSDLAQALGKSKATVSHHVGNLKDKGLLTATSLPDGRTEALEVIESGELLLMGDEDAEVDAEDT